MNMLVSQPTFGLRCPHAERVMQFLNGIGLPVLVVPSASGFIKHVEVVNGGLHVDPQVPASGLLHEAGHLALAPSKYRHYLNGDLNAGLKQIFKEVATFDIDPDSALMRALIQMSDPEVTAWAWAVGKHLGLEDEVIIQDSEYSGTGESLRLALSANCYMGINGLAHAGFCVRRKTPYRDLPAYPELAFWLQP